MELRRDACRSYLMKFRVISSNYNEDKALTSSPTPCTLLAEFRRYVKRGVEISIRPALQIGHTSAGRIHNSVS